jgi:nucleoside-diphosphate-sugar epimerase
MGSIGRNLVNKLVRSGQDVIIYDWNDINMSKRETLRAKYVCGDVRDSRHILKIINNENIKGIVHLAAISRVSESEIESLLCKSVNIGGTLAILQAIVKSKKKPYIVNCSSREVYGEPTELPVSETANLNPINSYGESKLKAEKLIQDYVAGYNLRAITLRPSNVYGSLYDLPNRAIPKFIRRALNDQPIEIYGGRQTIDFVHISDIVDGLTRAVSKLENMENIRYYDVFNLTSGVPRTLNDTILAISDYLGKNIKTVHLDPRRCDVQRFVGDSEKARIELGFKAKMPFNKGISMTVDKYQRFFDNFSYSNLSAIESSIMSAKEEVIN